MVKARKTRQQKQLADKKRFSPSFSTSISQSELTTIPSSLLPKPPASRQPLSVPREYEYVRHDLLRTLGITSLIISSQVALLFILT